MFVKVAVVASLVVAFLALIFFYISNPSVLIGVQMDIVIIFPGC